MPFLIPLFETKAAGIPGTIPFKSFLSMQRITSSFLADFLLKSAICKIFLPDQHDLSWEKVCCLEEKGKRLHERIVK
ncbi:hypothetical protein AB434_1852 [Heyndrickxia coagulans]|uniref:Uncharacterized protein n=1 Tax=Heyndrickxia coagulans TaxID=1398 RepID=A0A0C5CBQ6_HEYCO|nr:hypothetical protein SB48_HM08orf05557 [Heyndrickxia coagulans]AKN54257.1 hypothetical protein AB434_1852 [Heyndrickxia coagulans]APB38326.1 hypothetical protein BIZ35_17185 [Heyndrickxia coagulans]AVD55195.1 hypothetical protein C3766_03125 [Heyndrickxia coagulans]AWP36066.1 hypothetical protein CYJ15_03255 [Heyndrickxia coagulans]